MSDQPSVMSRPFVRYVLLAYVVGSFLWRLLTPAHEYPGRFSTYLEMAVDALAIAGLIGVRATVPKVLLWIALVAGVGLFAIRLNGDASWWTGHLMYSVR